jgi:hypothetical protein
MQFNFMNEKHSALYDTLTCFLQAHTYIYKANKSITYQLQCRVYYFSVCVFETKEFIIKKWQL